MLAKDISGISRPSLARGVSRSHPVPHSLFRHGIRGWKRKLLVSDVPKTFGTANNIICRVFIVEITEANTDITE